MNVWAVVVAAGRGERAGMGQNKVFSEIRGRSLLNRTLDQLERAGALNGIVLVLSEDDLERYRILCQKEGENALVRKIAYGGSTRRQSVYHGLCALPEDAEIVVVHDAARPFPSEQVIRATIESARKYGSGVISTQVTDTIKQIQLDGTVQTLDRTSLRAVQTPQTFSFQPLLSAHARADRENYEATDDAAIYEHYYGSVRLVTAPGAEANIKLTTRADFDKLNGRGFRIGSGYDAHRLAEGRKLLLCGTEIPHDRGLDGHSDADVAVHALMDALLGALGEGDIGRHFPDSEPQYKGISSMILLNRVMEIVQEHGYHVVNADITIVAQKPKLAGYIPEMQGNIARALKCSAVNVKATTTERMGFEGEEIGISAQAVVLLEED